MSPPHLTPLVQDVYSTAAAAGALFSWQPVINKQGTVTHWLTQAEPVFRLRPGFTRSTEPRLTCLNAGSFPGKKTAIWASRSPLSATRPLIRRLRDAHLQGAERGVSLQANPQRFSTRYKSLRQIVLRDAAVVIQLLCQTRFICSAPCPREGKKQLTSEVMLNLTPSWNHLHYFQLIYTR